VGASFRVPGLHLNPALSERAATGWLDFAEAGGWLKDSDAFRMVAKGAAGEKLRASWGCR